MPSNIPDTDRGATSLLKRARKQKKSSKKGTIAELPPFSEQLWGTVTSSYFQSISRRTPQALQDIVALAQAVLQEDCDSDSSGDDQGEGSEGEADLRALMCKLSISFICHTDTFVVEFCWFRGCRRPSHRIKR